LRVSLSSAPLAVLQIIFGSSSCTKLESGVLSLTFANKLREAPTIHSALRPPLFFANSIPFVASDRLIIALKCTLRNIVYFCTYITSKLKGALWNATESCDLIPEGYQIPKRYHIHHLGLVELLIIKQSPICRHKLDKGLLPFLRPLQNRSDKMDETKTIRGFSRLSEVKSTQARIWMCSTL